MPGGVGGSPGPGAAANRCSASTTTRSQQPPPPGASRYNGAGSSLKPWEDGRVGAQEQKWSQLMRRSIKPRVEDEGATRQRDEGAPSHCLEEGSSLVWNISFGLLKSEINFNHF